MGTVLVVTVRMWDTDPSDQVVVTGLVERDPMDTAPFGIPSTADLEPGQFAVSN